jgi:hypothetical protein
MDAAKLVGLLEDANHKPRSYSGRGMFGKECVSVSLDRHTDVSEFFADVLEVLCDSKEYETIYEFIRLMRETRTDGMGLGIVVYWPGIEWTEGLVTGRYEERLTAALANFNLNQAVKLVDRIDNDDDYELTEKEDTLCSQLLDEIDSERAEAQKS